MTYLKDSTVMAIEELARRELKKNPGLTVNQLHLYIWRAHLLNISRLALKRLLIILRAEAAGQVPVTTGWPPR
jgi:hypothetical protein